MASDPSYIPKIRIPQGGDSLDIAPGGKITGDGAQAAHVADAVAAAGANPTKAEYDALVAKFNQVLANLEAVGIHATA